MYMYLLSLKRHLRMYYSSIAETMKFTGESRNSYYHMTVMHLLIILVLFQGEDVFVEILLQLLIGKIDVELLKSIDLKVLKPKNVQNTNEGKLLLPTTNPHVYLLQDPAEEVCVESHGSGVT